MEKVSIELSFEADKLEALEYCLEKERTTAKKKMAESLQQLYEEKVPEAVREYLERKFGTLENFNRRCWTSFWSHRYGDWAEIEPDDPCMDSVALEWRRFATEQVCDFMKWEIEAVRRYSQHRFRRA